MKYKNITRLMQIAMAIEPIPNKKGLTTRYKDIGDNLKLEYFIIGSINSGFVIEELMNRKSGEVSYDLLFKSTVQNQLHRGGLRVNAGQLQFLWPILLVIREYPSIKDFNLILDKTEEIMLNTCREDSIWLQATNNFSYSLWEHHLPRVKLIDLECDSVFEAYTVMYEISDANRTYFSKEFLDGYPCIRKLYSNFDQEIPYSEGMSILYDWALDNIDEFPKGGIADILACVTFLAMYIEDYKIR
jgi:hypothetical protein